jgi:hypothetical protein
VNQVAPLLFSINCIFFLSRGALNALFLPEKWSTPPGLKASLYSGLCDSISEGQELADLFLVDFFSTKA